MKYDGWKTSLSWLAPFLRMCCLVCTRKFNSSPLKIGKRLPSINFQGRAVKFRGCINYDYSQRLEISHLPIIIPPWFHEIPSFRGCKPNNGHQSPTEMPHKNHFPPLPGEKLPWSSVRIRSCLVFENGGFWGAIHTKVGHGGPRSAGDKWDYPP